MDVWACCAFYAVRMFVEGMRFHGDSVVEIRFRGHNGDKWDRSEQPTRLEVNVEDGEKL